MTKWILPTKPSPMLQAKNAMKLKNTNLCASKGRQFITYCYENVLWEEQQAVLLHSALRLKLKWL